MRPYDVGELSDHTKGDSWGGFTSIGPILIDGSQPSSALSSCKMDFKSNNILGYRLSSAPGTGEGTITISDAATWELVIPKQLLSLPAGKWYWDIEFIDASGVVRTLLEGTLEIIQDYTYV